MSGLEEPLIESERRLGHVRASGKAHLESTTYEKAFAPQPFRD